MIPERPRFTNEPWRIEEVKDPGFVSAVEDYTGAWRENKLKPRLVDHFYSNLWRVFGERVPRRYNVPECTLSEYELAKHREDNSGALLIPDEITMPHGLLDVERIVPSTRREFLLDALWGSVSHLDPKGLVNRYSGGGCVVVEMDVDAPHKNESLYSADARFNSEGKRGQRVATYGVGSMVSKLISGRYWDEGNTHSRLPGTRYSSIGYSIATFEPDGTMHTEWEWSFHTSRPNVGHRSEKLIR